MIKLLFMAFLLVFASSFAAADAYLKGKLIFNGKPIQQFQKIQFEEGPDRGWAILHPTTGERKGKLSVQMKNENYEIHDLQPGTHEIFAYITLVDAHKGYYPGDYRGQIKITVPEGGCIANINLTRVFKLISPEDNRSEPLGSDHKVKESKSIPAHSAPIHFEWEAVEEAAFYKYEVKKLTFPPLKYLPTVTSGKLSKTSFDLNLPVNNDDAAYLLTIDAFQGEGSESKLVGRLWTYADKTNSWEYRFRIK